MNMETYGSWIIAALRVAQKNINDETFVTIATDDGEYAAPTLDEVDALVEGLNCGDIELVKEGQAADEPPIVDLTRVVEFARRCLADADIRFLIGPQMGVSADELLDLSRNIERYLSAAEPSLRSRQEDPWTSHPAYPINDWQRAVSEGDTTLGYWEWIENECLPSEDHFEVGDEVVWHDPDFGMCSRQGRLTAIEMLEDGAARITMESGWQAEVMIHELEKVEK